MITTTLNDIWEHDPPSSMEKTLLEYFGKAEPDDHPFGLDTLTQIVGIDGASWYVCAEQQAISKRLVKENWE